MINNERKKKLLTGKQLLKKVYEKLARIDQDFVEFEERIKTRLETVSGWSFAGKYSGESIYRKNDVVRVGSELFLSLRDGNNQELDTDAWVKLVRDGKDAREPEFQLSDKGHVEFRLEGGEWVKLFHLSQIRGLRGLKGLKGDKGDKGVEGKQGEDGKAGKRGKTPKIEFRVKVLMLQYRVDGKEWHDLFDLHQLLRYVSSGGGGSNTSSASTVENLDDVQDVVITSASNGQVLYYSSGNWVNGDSDDILEGSTQLFMTSGERTKVGYLTVTQAVDLDAIETRVDALDAAVVLVGTWDASAGSFAGSGSAQAGDSYIISTGGTVDGVEFVVGDRIVAITDNASTTTYASNWLKLDYTDKVASLDDLTDVDTDKSKTPADGDVLTYDGSEWNAETPASSGGGASPKACFYINGSIDMITYGSLASATNGASSEAVFNSNGGYRMSSGTNSAGYAELFLKQYNGAANSVHPWWDQKIYVGIQALFNFGGTGDADIYVLLGGGGNRATTNEKWVGFHLTYRSSTLTIYATSHDGTTEETTDVTSAFNSELTTGDTHTLGIVHDGGTNTKFYVNGTLVATHSTNIPSGQFSDVTDVIDIWCINSGATTQTKAYINNFNVEIEAGA